MGKGVSLNAGDDIKAPAGSGVFFTLGQKRYVLVCGAMRATWAL